MAPISNETPITPENVKNLTNEELKTVIEEGERRSTETAATLDHKETVSKAPKRTGEVYFDPKLPRKKWENALSRLTKQDWLFNLEIDDKMVTCARYLWTYDAFKAQGIEVKECNSAEEATICVKNIFRDFEYKFPDLWKENNRFGDELSWHKLYELFSISWAFKETNYSDYELINSGRKYGNNLWAVFKLPIRYQGGFVKIASYKANKYSSVSCWYWWDYYSELIPLLKK